jgi:hypothetical protein
MKTKTLIMVCLLSGIGLAQLSAQIPDPPDNKHGTGTVIGLHVYNDVEWQVFCNDELIDILKGTIYAHYEVHFDMGNFVFSIHHCTGEAVSLGFINENGVMVGGTGEAFKIIDMPHKYDPTRQYQYEHINCLGNQGTHYVSTFAWECNEPWGFIVIKANCQGSPK